MGLDIALGLVILIAAVRGWIKGFVSQAVRIGGFVACVYLADPVREQARPFVLAKLPKIDPAMMDRILWWVSAVVSYIVLVGLTTLAIQMMRTPPPPGMARSSRNDQFAGFLLGAAKGLVVAAFLTAGFHRYAADLVHNATWVQEQTGGSFALKWTDQYQPVPKIWATPVIRRFVEHIQRNGLKGSAETEGGEVNQVAEPVADEFEKVIEEVKAELRARDQAPD
jgi:uncharacterized membrane protein required for colicin V production